MLVQLDTLLTAAGEISPETYFVKRFFIVRLIFQDMLQAVKNLVKFLIIIVYIRQLKKQVNALLSLKHMNSFFQQFYRFALLVQCQVYISFENIDINIGIIQYFRFFEYFQGFRIPPGSYKQISFFHHQRGRIGELRNT